MTLDDKDLMDKLHHYAREWFLNWDESFQEFGQLVLDTPLEDLKIHAYVINMNLAQIMRMFCTEFKDGERDSDDIADLGLVMGWLLKL
ncbi:hypothetical protein VBJ55_22285 [Enterobacter hormaechei]|nr:hypothetical protein [Enterobacter hormaechei]